MSLKRRVTRLEGSGTAVSVLVDCRELSGAEREIAAADYRRANGLPPDALVVVISGADARL